MKFDDLVKKLTEAPVSEIGLHGDWKDKILHKYDKPSVKLLTKEGYLEKLKSKFAKNISIDFNLFFVKSKEAAQHAEVGIVDPNRLSSMISDVDVQPIINSINPNAITIVFTNNVGDSKVLLTPWMIAHRTGHVLYRGNFNDRILKKEWELLISDYVNTLKHCFNIDVDRFGRGMSKQDTAKLKKLFHSVGTFKSARTNNIVRPFEFIYEVFAQYLVEGEITFNDLEENICVYELQSIFEGGFSHILRASQGKLFLM